MGTYVSPTEKEYANKIAERAGTRIPGTTNMALIAFPVLEAILKRLEELEKKVKGE